MVNEKRVFYSKMIEELMKIKFEHKTDSIDYVIGMLKHDFQPTYVIRCDMCTSNDDCPYDHIPEYPCKNYLGVR